MMVSKMWGLERSLPLNGRFLLVRKAGAPTLNGSWPIEADKRFAWTGPAWLCRKKGSTEGFWRLGVSGVGN
jgi:hypothetical protein